MNLLRRLRPAVVVAGALALAACSAAGQSSPAAVTTAAPGVDVVHLTAYTDNDGPTSVVVVTGAIGDFGKAVRGNGDLEVDLSGGTFRLGTQKLEAAFATAMKNLTPNKVTCSGTATATGTAAVGSGTGKYAGIAGSLSLRITLDEVYTPPACTETSAYRAQVIVTTGSGTVTYHRP